MLTRLVDWLLDNWDRPDAGMWESRGKPQRHTTSRIMEWVALERAVRIARQRGLPGDITHWSRVRDEIYESVMQQGWDDDQRTFVQAEGSDDVDAGLLLLPQVKFLAPNDPRFLSTLAVIEERLVTDTLVFRYDVEAAPDEHGVVLDGLLSQRHNRAGLLALVVFLAAVTLLVVLTVA